MSASMRTGLDDQQAEDAPARLPFPAVTRQHILNCSYHAWHPRYRRITPKARLIELPNAFVDYLREDGIIVPPEESSNPQEDWDSDSGIFSKDDEELDSEDEDPSTAWPNVHQAVGATIAELGGKVVPKLNWSAPKDATWINATNSMDCRSPNDVYLLLKSSDFVTHDLEHAFDDCHDDDAAEKRIDIPYHLVLRKHIQISPALEFRCFARNRKLLGICQRDLNHFDFLFRMQDALRDRIQSFFDEKLKTTFPDSNFTFDVYIPPPHQRVWLIDINPWAIRTDPLLFSWLELLTMPEPPIAEDEPHGFVRLSLNGPDDDAHAESEDDDGQESDVDAELYLTEMRLIRKDDPEAYSFNTPQYSAHKLPRDVVDASQGGPGPLREFADQWKELLAQRQRDDRAGDSEDD